MCLDKKKKKKERLFDDFSSLIGRLRKHYCKMLHGGVCFSIRRNEARGVLERVESELLRRKCRDTWWKLDRDWIGWSVKFSMIIRFMIVH